MRVRVFRVGDDALLGQFGEGGVVAVVDRLAGHDPGHGVAGQFQAAHGFQAQQVGLQDQVEEAFLQLIAEVKRGIGDQLDLYQRVQLHQFSDQRAQPGVDHRVHRADPNAPDLAAGGLQGLLQALHGHHHLLGIVEHFQAFRGQAHTTRITQEQLHPQLTFQHGDAAGDRGLGGEQLLGREPEALELGHPDEGFEELQIHGINFFLCMDRFLLVGRRTGQAPKIELFHDKRRRGVRTSCEFCVKNPTLQENKSYRSDHREPPATELRHRRKLW